MSRDDAYLLDMLIAARRAAKHAAGLSEQAFRESEPHHEPDIRTSNGQRSPA